MAIIGEFAFIIGFIVSFVFIFSRKTFLSWSLLLLGFIVLVTSFNSLPTLVAGILFMLIGIYGTQRFKIPFLKDTKLTRGLLFLLTLIIIGGITIITNQENQKKQTAKDDIKEEKVIRSEINSLTDASNDSRFESVKNSIYLVSDSQKRKALLADYQIAYESHKDYLASRDSSSVKSSSNNSETKKNQEKQDYQHYLTALSKASDTTKGALTKAYYDDKNNYAVFVLDDAALSQSSNSLKTISKAAWDAGNRLYQEYKPFPSGVVPNMIKIEDSQGNIIAETSFTGNFKYTGE